MEQVQALCKLQDRLWVLVLRPALAADGCALLVRVLTARCGSPAGKPPSNQQMCTITLLQKKAHMQQRMEPNLGECFANGRERELSFNLAGDGQGGEENHQQCSRTDCERDGCRGYSLYCSRPLVRKKINNSVSAGHYGNTFRCNFQRKLMTWMQVV